MNLRVWHDGRDVGLLSAKERRLRFAYADAWRSDPQGFALSPRLPMTSSVHEGDEVMHFFANLLPEGLVLDTLCRLRRLPRGDVFRLLEHFGREGAGAFDILADGEMPDRSTDYAPYDVQSLRDDLADMRRDVPLLHRHGELRLSLAGAQNKLPVALIDDRLHLPLGTAASTHILKPALPGACDHSVENEALCMRLAAAVGIPTAAVQIWTDPEPMLLVERYDRVVSAGRITRLHQLDFCQLAGVLPDQKYESDGGPGFASLFSLVDAHATLPARDRLQLADWLVFNFLIGNADAHGKNASMHNDRDGRLRLAPAYDLLSTRYWPSLSPKMAMAIGGEKRPDWVMARNWQRLCAAISINLAQLRRRALALTEAAATSLPEVAATLGIDAASAIVKHLRDSIARGGAWIDERMTHA
jgi:serine/threonine-protein kinase HipA